MLGWLYVLVVVAILALAGYRLVTCGKPFEADNAMMALGAFALPFLPMLLVAVYSQGPLPALVVLLMIVCVLAIVVADIALLVMLSTIINSRVGKESQRAKLILLGIYGAAFLTLVASVILSSVMPLACFILILYVFGVYLIANDTCSKTTGNGLM